MTADPETRLVDRMRSRLEAGYWPRVHCMLIVGVSAAAAFVTSYVLMRLHIWWMAGRYGAAAIAGYLTFLLLLRAWARWRWSRVRLNADGNDFVDGVVNNIDLPMPSFSGGGSGPSFASGGGRSGGAGASGSWGPPVSSGSGGGGKGAGGGGLDLDGDDLFWVIVVVAAAFGGAIAIGYVIYIAPTLLAEAIVDAAVAGKVYHGMQRKGHEFWTEEIFKRTILSGVVVLVCAVAAGYALNRIAPEAISIGGVFAHLRR